MEQAVIFYINNKWEVVGPTLTARDSFDTYPEALAFKRMLDAVYQAGRHERNTVEVGAC